MYPKPDSKMPQKNKIQTLRQPPQGSVGRAIGTTTTLLMLQKRQNIIILPNIPRVIIRHISRLLLLITPKHLGSRGTGILIFLLVITTLTRPTRPIPLNEIPSGNGPDQRNDGEQPPRSRYVSASNAPGEGGAGEGGTDGAADGAEGRGEAVEGAEDGEGGAGVCEEDGHAGEADDDGEGFEAHDGEEGGVAEVGVGDQDGEGGEDVDYGEEKAWREG